MLKPDKYGEVTPDGTYEYTFKQVGVAASIVLYAKDTDSFLVLVRKTEPHKGEYAFPGGYIETDKESLREAAVRELEEEADIVLTEEQLYLIDARSEPGRDPKQHVVDIGFLAVVDEAPEATETDEGSPEWITTENIKKMEFAFDHEELLGGAIEKLVDVPEMSS